MRLTLLHELSQFLTELERTQQDLLTLFTAKREALDRRLSAELLRLSVQEGELTGKLQELVKERTNLLIKARGAGFAVE